MVGFLFARREVDLAEERVPFRLAQDSLEVCRVVFRIHLDVYFLTMRLRSCPDGVKANTPKVDGLAGGGEGRVPWGAGCLGMTKGGPAVGGVQSRGGAGVRSGGGRGGFPGWTIVPGSTRQGRSN